MIDDTNSSLVFYPSNKTISIGDNNTNGINIATGGAAFATNTINLGNTNSLVNVPGLTTSSKTKLLTPNYAEDYWPDTAPFTIANAATPASKIGIWMYNNTKAVIQASTQGIGALPLTLNGVGGNVGIGTTNPLYTLDVSGTMNVNGNTKMNGSLEVQYKNPSYGSGNLTQEGDLTVTSGAEESNASIYFRTPHTSSAPATRAIISKGGGWSGAFSGGLHFCLSSITDNSTKVTVADSKMMITPTGYVGIGTTGPSTALEIQNSRACIGIRKKTFATGDVSVLGFNYGGGGGENESNDFPDSASQYGTMFGARIKAVALGPYGTQSDLHFQYKTNAQYAVLTDCQYTTSMILRPGGNVGIGTTTPAYTLDLNGTARIAETIGVGAAVTEKTIGVGVTNNYNHIIANPTSPNVEYVATMTTSSANQMNIDLPYAFRLNTTINIRITCRSNVSDMYFKICAFDAPYEDFYISTTLPTTLTTYDFSITNTMRGVKRLLIVVTSTGAATTKQFIYSKFSLLPTTGETYIPIDGYSLDVRNRTRIVANAPGSICNSTAGIGGLSDWQYNAPFRIEDTEYNWSDGIKGYLGIALKMGIFRDTGAGYIQVENPNTAARDLVMQTYGGNVGIGTVSPAYKLDVAGTSRLGDWGFTDANIKALGTIIPVTHLNMALYQDSAHTILNTTGFIAFRMNNGDLIRMTSTGDFGIGTTTPAYKLDVNGNVHCSGDLYVGNRNDDGNNSTGGGRIYFGGTYGDNDYFHSQIVARKHDSGEGSELLIYKGNDLSDRIRLKAFTIQFDTGSGTNDIASETIRMTINSSGYVGIGRTDPTYLLDVNGTSRLGDYVISSDRRIKTSIKEFDSTTALNLFRKFQTKTYQYKDKPKTQYGFIAQEIDEIFPAAVDKIADFVYNIYSKCPVSGDRITLDTSLLEYDANGELFPKLKLADSEVKILKMIDPYTIQIDKTLDESEVFVFGQQVDNFHTLHKDTLWTVAAAALQEVDKQLQDEVLKLQQEKQKTIALQQEVQTLQTKYETTVSKYDSLESKYDSLESKYETTVSKYEQLLQRILALEAK